MPRPLGYIVGVRSQGTNLLEYIVDDDLIGPMNLREARELRDRQYPGELILALVRVTDARRQAAGKENSGE